MKSQIVLGIVAFLGQYGLMHTHPMGRAIYYPVLISSITLYTYGFYIITTSSHLNKRHLHLLTILAGNMIAPAIAYSYSNSTILHRNYFATLLKYNYFDTLLLLIVVGGWLHSGALYMYYRSVCRSATRSAKTQSDSQPES